MKVLITDYFCLRTGLDVEPGFVADVTEREARELFRMRRAKPIEPDAQQHNQEPLPEQQARRKK